MERAGSRNSPASTQDGHQSLPVNLAVSSICSLLQIFQRPHLLSEMQFFRALSTLRVSETSTSAVLKFLILEKIKTYLFRGRGQTKRLRAPSTSEECACQTEGPSLHFSLFLKCYTQ